MSHDTPWFPGPLPYLLLAFLFHATLPVAQQHRRLEEKSVLVARIQGEQEHD